MLREYSCEMGEYREGLSKYLHLPIVLVICPSKSSYIISASTAGIIDARIQSPSVNIVEIEVSCFSCCVRYIRFDVVSYDRCELICSKGIHAR